MELSELKDQYPDLVVKIEAEVTEKLTAKFDEEKSQLEAKAADLESQLQRKDEQLTSTEDRVLKLEKNEAIRQERDRKLEADGVWSKKLEASDIPEHLYEKVCSQVSYQKFVKDGKFDREAFGKAVDDEIADWISRGVTNSVIGGGSLSKDNEDEVDTQEKKMSEEDDEAVEGMLKLVGDPGIKK